MQALLCFTHRTCLERLHVNICSLHNLARPLLSVRHHPVVKMKPISSSKELEIPEGVDVVVKSRRFTVTGPRGKLTKDLSHIAADMYLVEDAEAGTKKLKVDIHFSSRKGLSSLRTVISHVSNMITGVTLGFKCVPTWSIPVLCRQPSALSP
jgi:hypothetical protein